MFVESQDGFVNRHNVGITYINDIMVCDNFV